MDSWGGTTGTSDTATASSGDAASLCRDVRVLIADDDESVRIALARLIERSPGLTLVAAASDSREAVALGLAVKPDVALVDVSMPGGGGVEVTRALRDGSPGTRVVALSGSTEREKIMAMLEAGATGYLVKGVSRDLAKALRSASRGEGVLAGEVASEIIGELGTRLNRQRNEETQRHQQEECIREAMNGGLHIAYQPIVDLQSGRIAGHEALSRFREGPRRPPDQWFAEAWAVGLGFELEMVALRVALEGMARADTWQLLAVNVSPGVLTDRRFGGRLASCPLIDRLIIEVTEHAVVDDYGPLLRSLNELRAAGARVAVDDCGAGYASLRHVLTLRPDLVKLDRSLVTDLQNDQAKRAVASGIVALAGELGASIVAEGIETEAELRCVTDLGATYGQGYYLGRPSPLGPAVVPAP